jgi:hypothetical protein
LTRFKNALRECDTDRQLPIRAQRNQGKDMCLADYPPDHHPVLAAMLQGEHWLILQVRRCC